MRSRIIFINNNNNNTLLYKSSSEFLFPHRDCLVPASQHRWITSTSPLHNAWMDKIKGVFTGKKTPEGEPEVSSKDFTLDRFADELKKARKVGAFTQYMVGRSSEATFSHAFEKHEAIIRYLGGVDATGENLQSSHKQEAAKKCNCTFAEVENALSKYTWAKEAQKKIEDMKKDGKPMPKSFAEVQKMMGSTPMDFANASLAKSGQISRNAMCPCGSNKRYKRCCGK